jgi:hypothetical protein
MNNDGANANAQADLVLNADIARQSDLAKLPLFSGESKDQFTAEQWIDRIDRAQRASNWTPDQTNTFIYNALRGNALLWYDSLPRTGINRENWNEFRTAFLESWSTVRTTRTATVQLADLKQGQNEPVNTFYPRVVRAIDDLEALIPGHAFPPPAQPWPQEFRDIAAFGNIPVATRAQAALDLVAHGATQAFNHIALNLFISNLRPALRDELLKQPPATLYAAFQRALTLERLAVEPKRPNLPAMPVDTSEVAAPTPAPPSSTASDTLDDLDKQIDALNLKRRNMQQRQGQRSGPSRAPGQLSNSNRFTNRPPASRDTICHYCKKPGHYQIDCRSRIRANAPLVRTSAPPRSGPSSGPMSYGSRPPSIHHVDAPYINQVDPIPYYAPFSYPSYPQPQPALQDFHYAEG